MTLQVTQNLMTALQPFILILTADFACVAQI